MPKRRSVLLSVCGAVAIAGCSDLQPSDEQEESDQQQETESDPQIQDQTEAQNQTETQSQTVYQRIERIESERNALEESLQMYAGFTEDADADILAVTSVSEEFDHIPIVRSIQDVTESLEREATLESDTEISADIRAVQREAELIESIARAQSDGQKAGEIAKEYDEQMKKSSYGLSSTNTDLVDQLHAFQTAIQTVEVRLENVSSPTLRERQLYDGKLSQFSDELTNFRIYADLHSEYSTTRSQFEDALSHLENENYSSAEAAAETAIEGFDSIVVELAETNDEIAPLIDSFEQQVESQKESATAVMRVAAELSS